MVKVMGRCIISAGWVIEQRRWWELDSAAKMVQSPPGPTTLLPLFGREGKISKEGKDISVKFRQVYSWERKAHCRWIKETSCVTRALQLVTFWTKCRSGEGMLACVPSLWRLKFFPVSWCLDEHRLPSDPWGDRGIPFEWIRRNTGWEVSGINKKAS